MNRSKGAFFALLLLLLFPLQAAADYKASFRKGIQALDRKQPAEAAAYFREALQERSQEGGEDVKITGTFFSPYLPHYYLGVALVATGDCTGAANAWRESERQGFISRTSKIKDLQTYKDQCLGPVLAQRFQAGQAEISSAEREQQALRSLPSGQVDRQKWKAIADREAKAQELLSLARKKLEEGQRNRNIDTLAEAKGLAANAGKEFQALREEGRSVIAQWQQAQAQAQTQAQSRPAPPEPPRVAQQQVPAPPPPAARVEATPPAAQPVPMTPEPIETSAAKPVPEPLLTGARAYFAADYPLTLRLLAKASFPDRRAAAQAALFRAAARMALYWRGADQNQSLLAAARKDIQEGRRMDPGLKVNARVFSPRFRSFFDNSR